MKLCSIHYTATDLNQNCVYCISDKRKSIADSACSSLAAICNIIEGPETFRDAETKLELIETLLKLSAEELELIALTQ